MNVDGDVNVQESRKRRRLCLHCNQRLAKTTYYEHQKRFCGASFESRCSSDSESDFSLVSEFELLGEGVGATVFENTDCFDELEGKRARYKT